MRKLKNILYITTPTAYLSSEGECFVISIEDKQPVRIPGHNLEGIVQFGYPGASPAALLLCSELGITISFLTQYGKFLSRVEGPQTGNILLRREQYRICDIEGQSAKLASRFISAKIINCQYVFRRAVRDYGNEIGTDLDKSINRLKVLSLDVFNCNYLATIRGIEGDAARCYFKSLNHLIRENKDYFYINGRNKRPPTDPLNCMLSFLYTLLAHECRSACETVGLDPQAGFLHRDRPGRPSLALDLMEELRAVYADRIVLTLINRKQINPNHFKVLPNNEVQITDKGKKILLEGWQKRKQDIIMHPFLQEKIEYGLIPYTQALLLSRFIRGDLEDYPAFVWR